MAVNDDPAEIARIVERAMSDFRTGMEQNTQFSIRIGRRTTQIIRVGMLSIGILGGALFYLVAVLTKDFAAIAVNMDDMAGNMKNMEQNFQAVSDDLTKIERAVTYMTETDLAALPTIDRSVGLISNEMMLMRENFESVNDHMLVLRGNVGNMDRNLGIMNLQMTEMNGRIGVMSSQMHDIAAPMRKIPFFGN